MAILMPNQKQKEEKEDDFTKVLKGLQVAGSLYGLYADTQKLTQMKADNELKLQEAARQREEFKMRQTEFDNKQKGVLNPDELSKLDVSSQEEPGRQRAVDRYGNIVFVKAKPAEKDPLTQESLRLSIEERRRKAQEDALKKTDAGKLQNLNSSDKQRYDNVIMANRSLQQMAEALNKGDSRYSLIGDNDFTAALGRYKEAVGRMQSGGAIGTKEAQQFIDMARSLGDNTERTQSKLNELNTIMRDRFKTLGFDPNNNPDMAQLTRKAEKDQAPQTAGFVGGKTPIGLTPPKSVDPKIDSYAKEHKLDYNAAESILRARGYGKKGN